MRCGLGAVIFGWLLMGACVSNPTPHPGADANRSEDSLEGANATPSETDQADGLIDATDACDGCEDVGPGEDGEVMDGEVAQDAGR